MRKLNATVLLFLLMGQLCMGQRYLTEIFPTVKVTSDTTYAVNYNLLPALVDTSIKQPILMPLRMDVYEPMGDTFD